MKEIDIVVDYGKNKLTWVFTILVTTVLCISCNINVTLLG